MQRELLRQKLLTRRAAILAGAQAALFGGLVERMYQLQIVDSSQYRVLADENRISLRLIAPPRGRIVDRFGTSLADNQPNYRVVIVREEAGDIDATLEAVGKLVSLGDNERRRILRDLRQHHPFVPVVIRENVSWDEMARIEVAIPELPGIAIEQGLTRFYPLGPTAAHALGYVAAVAERDLTGDPLLELPDFRIGKSGIERAQDLALRGTAGTRQVEVNAFGRVVRELTRTEAKPGADVVSSIDRAMQEFATARCAHEQSVASVLLDALTGDVLALVSHPGYDPLVFSKGLSQTDWLALSGDPAHPLVDKAVAGAYPPGSTFKPVVAAAALTARVLTPQTVVNCPGFIQLGNATFHCWRQGGHGSVRLHDAIKRSCDVYFYEAAKRLGIDRLAEVARQFGYGAPLGLDIPGEHGGLIPDRDWKLRTTGVAWQKGETLIAGIGQGDVLATPLQIATMVARLATGRAVVPRLVRPDGVMPQGGDQYAPDFGELGIDPQIRALVLDGMNAVCNEEGGTAYAVRIKEPGMAMGGKSGTSQVHRLTNREHGREENIPWKDRDHSLFVAFAPVGAPRYVCATIVEHGGFGSEVCAPICRDILLEVQRRDPARRLPEPAKVAVAAPPASPGGS